MIYDKLKPFLKHGALDNAVYVEVQNVANYFMQNKDENTLYSSFNKCLPSWKTCVLKFKTPEYIYSDEMGRHEIPKEHRVEHLIVVNSSETEPYISAANYFISNLSGELRCLGGTMMDFNKDGCFVPKKSKDGSPSVAVIVQDSSSESITNKDYISSCLAKILLFTFSFCHCKNVEKVVNHYDDRLVKRRAKDGKPQILKYYTLKIDQRSREGHAEIGGGGWENSLHICRGHFKNYTSESPLFGHYVGQVWCPMHVKGNPEIGMIKKDYVV